MKINLKRSALLLVMSTVLAFSSVAGQSSSSQALKQRISAFEVTNADVPTVLENLAKTYILPVGLEVITDKRAPSAKKTININIRKGTVRNVLDAIIQTDPRYSWKEIDGVVNVSPKQKDSLLDVIVRNFKVNEASVQAAKQAIIDLPEVRSRVKNKGLISRSLISLPSESTQGSPRISLTLHNVTVRQVLNEILKASSRKYWVFYRYGNHNEFFSIQI